MKTFIIIFALFSAQLGIAQTGTTLSKTTTNKANLEKVIYSDGNSNTYIITKDSIEYKSVKTQKSTYINYDEGTRKKTSISQNSFSQILKEVEDLFNNPSIQTKNREKTSGVLISITNNKRNPIIIKQSPEQEKFEILLKELINK